MFLNFVFFIFIVLRYKYFIFLQAGWTLFTNQRDIRLLRLFGKKTVVIFTGCDSRIPEMVADFEWNPCSNCPDDCKQTVGCNILRKKALIPALEHKFNYVISPVECAGLIKRTYIPAYFPRIINKFEPHYPRIQAGDKIKILHAPSNTHYKGTAYIRNAINDMQKENFNFEYLEVQGITNHELYNLIKNCHLVIDQMLVGYYGLLAVESMALGKPVVVYIRPDIWNEEETICPVINANPDTLSETLRQILLHPSQLEDKGRQSRAFVEKYHDAATIAMQYYNILNTQYVPSR